MEVLLGILINAACVLLSIVAIAGFALALAVGHQGVASMIALMSFCLNAVYGVFMDLPLTLRHGQPFGDLSGLWFIAKGPALLVGVSATIADRNRNRRTGSSSTHISPAFPWPCRLD